MGNLSFDFAEFFEMNGPVTIVTFALVFRHYGWYNLSLKGIIISKGFIETLSTVCEGLLFIYIGLSFPNYFDKLKEIWLYIVSLFFIVALLKLIQLNIIRCIRRCFFCKAWMHGYKITYLNNINELLILWTSSQFKGAVSIALILSYENGPTS